MQPGSLSGRKTPRTAPGNYPLGRDCVPVDSIRLEQSLDRSELETTMAVRIAELPAAQTSNRLIVEHGIAPDTRREIVALARQLASAIADGADADQWAIAVVGLPELGAPDFEELVPRKWLEL